MTQSDFTIRTATYKDHKELANLIHFEVYVHRHLDWRPPVGLGWLSSFFNCRKRWRDCRLACMSTGFPSIAWIRMFAVSSDMQIENTWNALWNKALSLLKKEKDIKWVAAIPIHAWFQTLLRESSFRLAQRVVMLSWERQNIPTGNIRFQHKFAQ